MNVRLRRLQADHDRVQKLFGDSPHIRIKEARGDPPETYEIEYRLKGLMLSEDGEIVERDRHSVEINLPREYPRRKPQCKMLTPAFHPNIDSSAICIADHWAPSESLADLIVRIGQLLAFQDYNTKSPLDGEAARWAEENGELFPVDSTDLIPAEPAADSRSDLVPAQRTEADQCCENCGARSSEVDLVECAGGHLVCPDCAAPCERCGRTVCVLCELSACALCGAQGCDACLDVCPFCDKQVCAAVAQHWWHCSRCGTRMCKECAQLCSVCDGLFCPEDVLSCRTCGEPICVDCAEPCFLCGPDFAHHASELTECSVCGLIFCERHVREGRISGDTVCNKCGLVCTACTGWVARIETIACTVCGQNVCAKCAMTCQACGKSTCPDHVHECDMCGRQVCRNCSFICPECDSVYCDAPSHKAECGICGELLCIRCLVQCNTCSLLVCGDEVETCPFCRVDGCLSCLINCPKCDRLLHEKHLGTCALCDASVCPTCLHTCKACGREVCEDHFYNEHELCVRCFERRDKWIAVVGITLVGLVIAGVIALLVFVSSGP